MKRMTKQEETALFGPEDHEAPIHNGLTLRPSLNCANTSMADAAWELYDALKWAMRHAENVFALADRNDPERKNLEAARAAIAKAEGNQPIPKP